jgi:hypothetical protein
MFLFFSPPFPEAHRARKTPKQTGRGDFMKTEK